MFRKARANVRGRTDAVLRRDYRGRDMQNDLVLMACRNPSTSCAHSDLLMARLPAGGIFELLSSDAWARALGYLPGELSGKGLRELMPLETRAASEILADLLDPAADAPLDVPLRCKDAQRKYFRFYRRFDDRAATIFLVADELG